MTQCKLCKEIIALDTRVEYVEKAIDKSEKALQIRLENMNEFRKDLKNQQETFLTRAEYDIKHELL